MQGALDFLQLGRAVTLGGLATGGTRTRITALESSSLLLASEGVVTLDL